MIGADMARNATAVMIVRLIRWRVNANPAMTMAATTDAAMTKAATPMSLAANANRVMTMAATTNGAMTKAPMSTSLEANAGLAMTMEAAESANAVTASASPATITAADARQE